MTLTAARLIELRKARLGAPPRRRHKLSAGEPLVVRDLSLPSRPERSMKFDLNRVDPVVTVRTISRKPLFLERIELLHANADQRLARYELFEDSLPAPGSLG